MPRPRELRRVWPAGSPGAAVALTARDDIVAEVPAGPGRFVQELGPFSAYERTVDDTADGVVETTRYRLEIPWFWWLFELPMRRVLRDRRAPGAPLPWWSPPDRLTARQANVLGLLAAASLSAAFTNTLFTQTANFAAKSFGISAGGQGVGGVVVRLGVVIVLPFAVLADRLGRRRMLVLTAWLSPVFCVVGALAPTFWVLVATQAVARPLGLALALLIGVVVIEEMPRNSRAYALSVLAMAGGLGAGIAVGALRLADLGDEYWRLGYVIALFWLVPALHLARGLPETKRFQVRHAVSPRMHRGRFGAIASVAIISNLFVAPASFFQNRYLEDIRGYSGGGIALFTICTATPASVGLILGGRVADAVGRRVVIITCIPVSTLFLVGAFTFDGPAMWLCALVGGLLGALSYPALQVYRTELFPTGNRGRANGLITALALGGGSIGLLVVGRLVDHGWSYASVMALVAAGQLAAAVVAFACYPESAHLELEELNPEDATGTGPALSEP